MIIYFIISSVFGFFVWYFIIKFLIKTWKWNKDLRKRDDKFFDDISKIADNLGNKK